MLPERYVVTPWLYVHVARCARQVHLPEVPLGACGHPQFVCIPTSFRRAFHPLREGREDVLVRGFRDTVAAIVVGHGFELGHEGGIPPGGAVQERQALHDASTFFNRKAPHQLGVFGAVHYALFPFGCVATGNSVVTTFQWQRLLPAGVAKPRSHRLAANQAFKQQRCLNDPHHRRRNKHKLHNEGG